MDITLALGGGGVRGYAHLGVIHVLQKTGFRIRGIAGSSAGAIVGALVSAGYGVDTIEQELDGIDMNHVFQRHPGDNPSILGLAGIETLLDRLIGDRTFEDLELPFAATGVDLKNGQSVSFREGKVLDAVMASIAVPGFFPPRDIDEKTYIDGSVLTPVPVKLARQLASGVPVVAVVLSSSLKEWGDSGQRSSFTMTLPLLDRFLERSRLIQSFSILLTAVDIGSMYISDLTLELDHPDVLLRPKLPNIGLLERVKGEKLVTAGEDAAFAALDEMLWAVSWKGKLARKIPWTKNVLKKYMP